jgi:hypothetical protein
MWTTRQVQMLGHDRVPDDHKAIPPAHLLQHFEEQIAIRRLLQQRQPVIAVVMKWRYPAP